MTEELTNEKKKLLEDLKKSWVEYCPYCGGEGTIFIHESGFYKCNNCGAYLPPILIDKEEIGVFEKQKTLLGFIKLQYEPPKYCSSCGLRQPIYGNRIKEGD